ncbi:MAG TPA: two-component regulator propeller domain-containing protein, partial [Bacteroidales bacterium]|nr:two-component regulator propeller domain-containing protein [Bacteroidales bacterium]
MNKAIRQSFIITILLFLSTSGADAQVAIGEWRTHLSYNLGNLVMVTNEKVYCSTTGGLFYYNTSDNSINLLSKTEGLSDNGVDAMSWNTEKQLALLAYKNANLDLISGNEIINIPDIMKKQLPGDKTIYDVYFNGGKAYLSCGFGIVVVDIERFEISETYLIGENGDRLKVNQVTSDGDYLYAATDMGIRRADMSGNFLMDFNSWELVTGMPDSDGIFGSIVYYNNRLFAVYKDPLGEQDRIYYYDGSWVLYRDFPGSVCDEVRISGGNLLFTGEEGVEMMNTSFRFVDSYTGGNPRSASLGADGTLWIADNGRGLVKYDGVEEATIKPNGPLRSLAFDMASSDGILYAVSGGVTTTYNNIFRNASVHRFKDKLWNTKINYDYNDLITMAIDPSDPGHFFAGSWGYGLFEYRDWELEMVYDETNSSLQNVDRTGNIIRIGGVAYDQESNLWMTNTGVSAPISVLKADGTWKNFKFDGLLSSYPALGEVVVTRDNHIWGIINKGGGLFAMDHNGTIDNEEDDIYTLVSVEDENGNVITNDIYSMAEDQNGSLWLGTGQGILVFYSPSLLFENGR